MTKRLFLLSMLLAAALVLGPGKTVKAADGRETHYAVYYNCIISPPSHELVGEWDVDCNGDRTGWGWQPGSGCTETVISYGNFCY